MLAANVADAAVEELSEMTSTVLGAVAKGLGESALSVGSYFGSALESASGLATDLVHMSTTLNTFWTSFGRRRKHIFVFDSLL